MNEALPAAPRTDRRRFLRDAASLAAAAGATGLLGSLAACAPTGRAASPTTARPPATTATSPTTTTEPLDPAAWSALAASLAGRLVQPDSADYGAATLVYNLRFAGATPAAVAYCAGPDDVRRGVDFARLHGLSPTARSGGHSYAGYSTGSGRLVIDVSEMAGVSVDAGAATAVIGAGAQLVDVYSQLSAAGLLLPAGSCPSVGIAGLTLGGGIGVLGRAYGLTCDNLRSLEIVTADGRLVSGDPTENADLYWASRGGGGGNFGIATSFTFGLHPLPDNLSLFTYNWPWAAAGDVVSAWCDWIASAPNELWSNCQLQSAGPSGLNVRANGVFVGPPAQLSAVLQPFLARAGSPSSSFLGPEQYLHAMLVEAGCEDLSVAQCHLSGSGQGAGGGGADGTLARSAFAARSAYFSSALSAAAVTAATGAVEDLRSTDPALGGGLVFDAYGGAINAVAPDATAFVHRRALCALQMSVSWAAGDDPATLSSAESWLARAGGALAPFATGAAYQNYVDPTLSNWAEAYYGANLPRLVAVKRRYDPDDLFHFAQSIPTTLSPGAGVSG